MKDEKMIKKNLTQYICNALGEELPMFPVEGHFEYHPMAKITSVMPHL